MGQEAPRRRARARVGIFYDGAARAPDGKFIIVPYSVEYQPELAMAAARLREAAALTAQPTLRAFLGEARGGVLVQRLLRIRPGLDEARREHRADHWSL